MKKIFFAIMLISAFAQPLYAATVKAKIEALGICKYGYLRQSSGHLTTRYGNYERDNDFYFFLDSDGVRYGCSFRVSLRNARNKPIANKRVRVRNVSYAGGSAGSCEQYNPNGIVKRTDKRGQVTITYRNYRFLTLNAGSLFFFLTGRPDKMIAKVDGSYCEEQDL